MVSQFQMVIAVNHCSPLEKRYGNCKRRQLEAPVHYAFHCPLALSIGIGCHNKTVKSRIINKKTEKIQLC